MHLSLISNEICLLSGRSSSPKIRHHFLVRCPIISEETETFTYHDRKTICDASIQSAMTCCWVFFLPIYELYEKNKVTFVTRVIWMIQLESFSDSNVPIVVLIRSSPVLHCQREREKGKREAVYILDKEVFVKDVDRIK